MAPYFYIFFAVVQKMHYFCANVCKFSTIIENNYTCTSPSKDAIWDEFSKQKSILTIAFSMNYLLRPNNFRKRATTIAVAIVGRTITIWEATQKRSKKPIQHFIYLFKAF